MSTTLDILIRARDAASSTIRGVSSSTSRLNSALGTTGKTTSKMGGFFGSAAAKLGGLLGVAYGAKAAFDFGQEAIDNAEDAKRSLETFNSALNRTGQTSDINEDKFNGWLQSMGESIGQDDEDLRDLATTLVSAFDFSKLKGDSTHNLMLMSRSIQDVSAATQKSSGLVKRAFITLANDPAGAVTQFQKLGVITEEQADHFKAMAEKGRDAAVTQQILTLTGKRYGGAAEANTTSSQKLATIWENMKESLGNFLLPLFERFVDWLSRGISAFRDLASGGTSTNGVLNAVAAALKAAWAAVKGLAAGFQAVLGFFMQGNAVGSALRTMVIGLTAAFLAYKLTLFAISTAAKIAATYQALLNGTLALNPIGLVIAAVVLLAVIIVKNWTTIKNVTLAVWGGIKAFFFAFWNIIKKPIIAYFNFYKAIFKVAFAVAKGVFNIVKGIVVGVFNFLKTPVIAYFNFYKGVFRIASTVAKTAFNAVKTIVVGVWHAIQAVWRGAGNFFAGIWNGVKDAASAAFGFIRNFWNSTVGGFGFTIPDWVPIVGGKEFRIPLMAAGGIVNGPTLAMIGEAGPEAVIPLSKLEAMGGGPSSIDVRIGRRHFVDESDFEAKFAGF